MFSMRNLCVCFWSVLTFAAIALSCSACFSATFSASENAAIQTTEFGDGAHMEWRKGAEKAVGEVSKEVKAIGQENLATKSDVAAIRKLLEDKAARDAASDASQIEAIKEVKKEVKAEKPTIIERVKGNIDEKKGFVRRLLNDFDAFDWIVVVFVVIVSVLVYILLKKGGVHTLVESRRSDLEEDVLAGGLKGRAASRLLSIHDGAVGAKLEALEARVASVVAKVDSKVNGPKEAAVDAVMASSDQTTI